MVKQSTKKVSSNLYDRLARTDTFASRRLKEKIQRSKDGGRPLFTRELEEESMRTYDKTNTFSVSEIKHTKSTSTVSTCSSSGMSKRSTDSNRTRSTSSRGQSIFDRLASTGTKSSLRKHKQSATYVNDDTTMAESVGTFHYRDFSIKNSSKKRYVNNISFLPNQNEAEI